MPATGGDPERNGVGPDPETIALAGRLYLGQGDDHPTGERMSERAVGRHLGVSQPTAHRYIAKALQAGEWVDLIEREQGRAASAARLEMYWQWIREEAEKRDADPDRGNKVDLIPLAVKVEERGAKLGGWDAPTRVQNDNTNRGALIGPADQDAAIAAAVLRERQRNAKRRTALDSGDRHATVNGAVVTNGNGPPPGGPETNGDEET